MAVIAYDSIDLRAARWRGVAPPNDHASLACVRLLTDGSYVLVWVRSYRTDRAWLNRYRTKPSQAVWTGSEETHGWDWITPDQRAAWLDMDVDLGGKWLSRERQRETSQAAAMIMVGRGWREQMAARGFFPPEGAAGEARAATVWAAAGRLAVVWSGPRGPWCPRLVKGVIRPGDDSRDRYRTAVLRGGWDGSGDGDYAVAYRMLHADPGAAGRQRVRAILARDSRAWAAERGQEPVAAPQAAQEAPAASQAAQEAPGAHPSYYAARKRGLDAWRKRQGRPRAV